MAEENSNKNLKIKELIARLDSGTLSANDKAKIKEYLLKVDAMRSLSNTDALRPL